MTIKQIISYQNKLFGLGDDGKVYVEVFIQASGGLTKPAWQEYLASSTITK